MLQVARDVLGERLNLRGMLGIVAAICAVLGVPIGVWARVQFLIKEGRWRPIQLSGTRGVGPLLGGKSQENPTIGDGAGTSRAVRVWMHNRSGVAQDVHVRTGRKRRTSRFIRPWRPRGQLVPRTIHLEPNHAGDVQLKVLPRDDWPPQQRDPRMLPVCWLWLVVETASGHRTSRLVRTHLIGSECSLLW